MDKHSWQLSEHYQLNYGWTSNGQPPPSRVIHKGQGLMTGHLQLKKPSLGILMTELQCYKL